MILLFPNEIHSKDLFWFIFPICISIISYMFEKTSIIQFTIYPTLTAMMFVTNNLNILYFYG